MKIAGIKVSVHWTFVFLILWIIYSNVRAGLAGPDIMWMILFVLSLFVCVTLHELGHALAGKRYGIQTKDITLYPIGGVARMERLPEKPKQELVVAISGPAVNIVIMLILSPFIVRMELPDSSETILKISRHNFLAMLGIVNMWLALFNLIPAFPMDGGRVLRALLSFKLGRVQATNIASLVGKILAVGFVLAGFYLNPFLIFIGLFVFLGAHSENLMVQNQSELNDLTASNAVMRSFISFDKSESIATAVNALLNGQARNFLITDNNIPIGYVTRESLVRGISTLGMDANLERITNKNLKSFDIHTPLTEIFPSLQVEGAVMVLITDQNVPVGIMDAENIAELIMVRTALKKS